MEWRRYLTICILLLIGSFIQAQNRPIQVQIIVPQPLPISSTQILGSTGQTVLSLMNTDPLQDYKVMIGGTLTGDNGVTGTVDPRNKQPADIIYLEPGAVKFFTGDQILSIFSNYSITDIQYGGITAQELALNPIFPEGAYTICVQVYDINTNQPLSNDPPMGCTPPLIISTPDPPIITNPMLNETFVLNNFQLLNFAWTPVILPSGMANYELIIAQLPQGVNPYDALESQNLVWVSETKLFAPYFLYDQQYPPLDKGQYVVRVRAYDENGIFPIKNDGWSDAVVFEVVEQSLQAPFIQSPSQGQVFSDTEGPNAKLSWSLPTPVGSLLSYAVKVAEVPDGYTAQQAFNKEALIKVDAITNTEIYVVGLNETALEVGKNYAVQVQVEDPNGQLSFLNNGWSETHLFSITEPIVAIHDAPIIQSPQMDEFLDAPVDFSVKWIHNIPNNIKDEVRYELQIWAAPPNENYETFIGQEEPIIVISNIDDLEQAITDGLVAEERYIARIQAQGTDLVFQNNGYSDFVLFSIEEEVTTEQLEFICGEGCEVAAVEDNAPSTKFGNGDLVNIGNVTIKLSQVTKSQNKYNGTGKILTSDFFSFPIAVQLIDLMINEEGQAYAGQAIAQKNNVTGMPTSWRNTTSNMQLPNNTGQLLNALEGLGLESMGIHPGEAIGSYNLTQTELQEIITQNNSLQQLENPSLNIDLNINTTDNLSNIDLSNVDPVLFADFIDPVKLPQRFGDIYITSLTLKPNRASAKLASIKALSNNKHLVFAEKEVCFSAGGPAVQGVEAHLPLLQDVVVEEKDFYNIHIQKTVSGAPNDGTAMLFSCSPEQTVATVGYVEIDNNKFRKNNQIATLYGRFVAEWEDWEDWTAELREVSANELNSYSSGDDFEFQFKELKGYDFTIDKLMLDHSNTVNISTTSLPEGADPASNFSIMGRDLSMLWTGIYVEEGTLLLPKYITNIYVENTPTNTQRIALSLSNFVIDGQGLSGQVRKNYNANQSPFFLDQWELFPNNVTIDIQSNELEDALWTGNLNIPLLDGAFPVEMETYWSGYTNRINFDIQNIENQTQRISGWNADFVIDGNSEVRATLYSSGHKLRMYTMLNGILNFDTEMHNIKEVDLRGIEVTGLRTYNTKTIGGTQIAHVSIQSYRLPTTTQKIAGFPALVRSLQTQNYYDTGGDMEEDKAYLRFGIDFTLDDMIGGLTTSTDFDIRARVLRSGYEASNHFIHPIPIQQTDFQGCGFSGNLIYTATPNSFWFRGDLEGNMLGVATSMKGHTGSNFGNKFWALEVEQDFPVPLSFAGPMMIKSMGGGLYYHMKKQYNENAYPLPRFDFLPPPNSSFSDYGFYINTVMLTADGGKTLNGRFALSVDLDDRGLESMSLDGFANFSDDEVDYAYWLTNSEPSLNAPFSVDGNVTLNFRQPYIQGSFGYRINYDNGFITGNGNDVVGFRLSPEDWYVRIGTDNNRINCQMNYAGEASNIEGYFTTGGNLTSPTTLIENIQFLIDGDLKVSSPGIWVPLTRKDRVKVRGQLGFTFQGDIGWNLNPLPCTNHNPASSFFTYASASVSPSVSLYYKESCDSWVFFFDEEDCGRYDKKFGFGMSVETQMYAPRPTGFYVGSSIDLPVLDPFTIGWTIGQECK